MHSAKEMPPAFIGVHELPGGGGQIQSIRQIFMGIEEHYVVEALLGHGRSQVGVDASEDRKRPFPSCGDNRDCEINPHQFVYLTKHAGTQWCSGKPVSQGANPGDLGGMSRVAVQKIWQHTELSFKLSHVNVLVIQVVNFRRDQWSIICSRISQSDHESRAKAW